MNQMSVTVQAKLVVGYWELVPTESGSDNSSEKGTSTVTKELEEPTAKRKKTLWWKEDNWTRPKEDMDRQSNPVVDEEYDADYFGLGKDLVSLEIVANYLQRIGRNPITYDNSIPKRKRAFLSQR